MDRTASPSSEQNRIPLAELMRSVPMDRLMEDLNIGVTTHAGRTYATCWVHPDRTASVVVNDPEHSRLHKWHYHCMACGEQVSGDNMNLVQTRLNLSAKDAYHWLQEYAQRGGHGAGTPTVVRERPRLAKQRQIDAVASYLDLVRRTVPQAQSQGYDFLRSRGIVSWLAADTPAYALTCDRDARSVAKMAIASADKDLYLEAGLLKTDRKTGQIKPVWPDAVCLLGCVNRSGDVAYLIGRRFAPTESFPTRYLNQTVEQGATRIPGNLAAIARARQEGKPLRIVEGLVKALGSESLTNGLNAPAIGMLSRVGYVNRIDQHQQSTFGVLLEDLKSVPRVEVVADNEIPGIASRLAATADRPLANDEIHPLHPTAHTTHALIIAREQAKHAEGELMAANLAAWLSRQGVNATAVTLAEQGLAAFKDYDEVAKNLRAGGRRTADVLHALI